MRVMVASLPSLSESSSSSYDPLNKRVDFKLHGARIHLHNLKRLESIDGALASSRVRLQVEIELDEFLYYLVGVKDALLQEINSEFHLGVAPQDVKEESINSKLKEKHLREDEIDDLMTCINKMKSSEKHPLRRINELHNQSKHRNMLPKHIVTSDGKVSSFALEDPMTGKRMNKQIIEYLDDSYNRIERLQKRVRKEIAKHHII